MKSHYFCSLMLLSTIGFAPVAIAQNYVPEESAQFYGETAQLDAEIEDILRSANQAIAESNQAIAEAKQAIAEAKAWEQNDANSFYDSAETSYQYRENRTWIYRRSGRSYQVASVYSDEPYDNTYYHRPMPNHRRYPGNPRFSNRSPRSFNNDSQVSYRVPDPEPSIVASEPSIVASEPSIVASEQSIAAFEPSIVASEQSIAAPETSVAAYTPSDAVRSASYYALLADDEKVLYTSLYKAAAQREASVKFAGDIDDTKIMRVIKSLAFDHPELAWLINGFASDTTAKDGQVGETEVFFKYNDLVGSADQVTQELEAAAAKILAEAKKYSTIEERERYIHDILNRSVTYMHGVYDQNAYGALVGQQAVCVGISSAFKYLLDRLDIPNYIVFGKMDINGTPENHAWNLVVIDGRCYNVDVTSDNINITRGNQTRNEVDHRLFNKSDSDFRSRGYVRESEYSENAVKLPECW